MDNPLYMRGVHERIEHHLANAIRNREFGNFERFEGALLVDNLGNLNFSFESPSQLGPGSSFGVTVSTIATGVYEASDLDDRLKRLEDIVASLKALLAKKVDLDKRGYIGTYYENKLKPLDEMGFEYNVPAKTPEDLERVIDDFVAKSDS
ncbi:MAG: hypothetical protein AABX63_05905 [Nanoarchaeota archaeon]